MSFNFEDNFWEEDFAGVQGFEVLLKRLKDGKKMAQDFEEFLKARAKLEESYAKDMQRLAKNAHGESETGTLRGSWEVLRSETESCSREHFAVSQRMASELEKTVKDFKEKQRESRKRVEDAVKKAQASKKASYLNESKAKQDYYSKCRAADKAEEVVAKSTNLPPKKQEEVKSKAKRARLAAEAADAAYLEAVRLLDENRVIWEKEMEVGCQQLEVIERERIIFIRGMMWKYCNVCSSMSVQEDVMYENVRVSLEKCDEEHDLRQFVEQKATGCTRPAPIEYENFYDGRNGGGGVAASSRSASHIPSQTPLRSLPNPPSSAASNPGTSNSVNSPMGRRRAPAAIPTDSGAPPLPPSDGRQR